LFFFVSITASSVTVSVSVRLVLVPGQSDQLDPKGAAKEPGTVDPSGYQVTDMASA
jgi:hypothetical protein